MKNLAILLAFVFVIAGAVIATSARAVEGEIPAALGSENEWGGGRRIVIVRRSRVGAIAGAASL